MIQFNTSWNSILCVTHLPKTVVKNQSKNKDPAEEGGILPLNIMFLSGRGQEAGLSVTTSSFPAFILLTGS